ncbi:MAG: DUF417 family protein, partial [Aeromonas veronii]
AIKPLVASHPLMSWLYGPLSEQSVSNLIGVVEIVIAIGLVVGLWQPRIGYWCSMGAIVTFLATLSFLLTLTGVWKVVDGVPVTEFFLFKDLVFLGVVLHYQHRIRASLPTQAA